MAAGGACGMAPQAPGLQAGLTAARRFTEAHQLRSARAARVPSAFQPVLLALLVS